MWRRVWIQERKGKRGISHALRWYGDDGRLRTKSVGRNNRAAESARRELEMRLNSGSYADEVKINLKDFINEHVALIEHQVSPATVKDHRASLERFLEYCGNRRLDSVNVSLCEGYFSTRLAKVRPATANKDRRTLQAVFQRGILRGYLKDNPWAKVKAVREPEKALRILTEEEIGRVLQACPSLTWEAFILVAVSTGLRSGELCWLEWEDVDLDDGILLVRCKEEHRTKSGRNRTVALVPSVAALLKRLHQAQIGRWVFQTFEGTRFGNNVRREFGKVVRKAGIRYCTIHDLRRTFVSHLAMAGVNEAVVQKLAGHASMQTTLKHYTAILPEVARQAPGRLPWAHGFKLMPNSYQGDMKALETKTA